MEPLRAFSRATVPPGGLPFPAGLAAEPGTPAAALAANV